MKKRIFAVVTAFVFSVLSLDMNIFASSDADYALSVETLATIEERLINTITEGKNTADLTDLDIVVRLSADGFSPEYKSILKLVADVNAEYGLIRYGDYYEQYFMCSPTVEPLPSADMYGNGDNRVSNIFIIYDEFYLNNDRETCNTELAKHDKKLAPQTFDDIISCVDDSMTDIEKALRIHDYLILLNNYPDAVGVDNLGNEYYEEKAYKGISLLTDHNGVCMSYAKIYASALNSVGVVAITVDSTDMLHEWNMIEIDGEWYHVDVTWDDPRYTYGWTEQGEYNADNWDIGAVKYNYFLLSDEEMLNNAHYGWVVSNTYMQDDFAVASQAPVSGNSGAFNDFFFKMDGSTMPVTNYAYCDGYWYFYDILKFEFMRVKCEADATPEIMDSKGFFKENTATYLGEYGGSVYIATRTDIYRYDPEENKIGKILTAEENKVFSEMSIIENKMTLIELDYNNSDEFAAESETLNYDMALIENTGDFEIPPEKTTATTTKKPETTASETTAPAETTVTTTEKENVYKDYSDNLIIYAISAGLIIIAVVIIFVAVMKKNQEKNL